jgi:hypothetical protein
VCGAAAKAAFAATVAASGQHGAACGDDCEVGDGDVDDEY